ncbi:MAG: DUF1428 domain-containing protein [Patescibacteria group bacterium]
MIKAKYVDGFVLVVPEKDLVAYKKMAAMGGKMWKKAGALDYMECVGDDMHPKMGQEKIPNFPDLVNLKKGELVVFSYITYKSRKHRDQVNAKVMKEMEKAYDKHKDQPMPFDMKRMNYGGFTVLVGM